MITKIFGLILVFCSLALVYFFESTGVLTGAFRIFHWPAITLTGIGPVGIILICSDWNSIREAFKLLFRVSLSKERSKIELEAKNLHDLSQRYYLQGVSAFENFSGAPISGYLQRTLKRLSSRIPISDVRDFLERERKRADEKLEQAVSIANLGVRMAPSVGMLGTIIGMVQLLASLSDPSQIGPHMSLALLTTFYGLFFSLVFWTPIVQHLKGIKEIDLDGYDQVLHWLELMEERKPSLYLAERNHK